MKLYILFSLLGFCRASELTKLTIETRDCAGCSSLKAASGATIQITTSPPSGEISCTTNILDDPAATDYSGQAVFEDIAYLSNCFMIALWDLTEFKVTWTGAGTWTPEKFILERGMGSAWPYCCFNDDGVTVSDGQTQTFTCIESSAASFGIGCKTLNSECTTDTDCAEQDYCADEGACVVGCRDPGSACKTSTNVDGKCSGNHKCIQQGEAVLSKLIIETRYCAGCSSRKAASGATIQMTVSPPSGEESCSTNILDDPAATDYSGQAVFEDFAYLSSCFMINLGDLTKFQVTWTGAGTWTPGKFILERRRGTQWPYCCFNDGGLYVADGQTQTFTCIESNPYFGTECEFLYF